MQSKAQPILLCDDDPLFCRMINENLGPQYDLTQCQSLQELVNLVQKQAFSIILLDIQFKKESQNGLDLLPKLKQLSPQSAILILSGFADFKSSQKALRLKADDFISKKECLLHLNERIKFHLSQSPRNKIPATIGSNSVPVTGTTPLILELKERISRATQSHYDVLILGETGTGKERVARAFQKPNQPWVSWDAATLTESMADSLLFGHEKGAFTGAEKTSPGLFEQARGGCVFIDEIANLSIENQQRLLRVLQERVIRRVGGHKEIPVRFRLICASNQKLDTLCEKGAFLWDLYFRLSSLTLEIPPLKSRLADWEEIMDELQTDFDQPVRFSKEAMGILKTYDWPGNLRQLQTTLRSLHVFYPETLITPKLLPLAIRSATQASTKTLSKQSFYQELEQFEKERLHQAFQEHNGQVREMALALKMDRSHLYRKLKQYKINRN